MRAIDADALKEDLTRFYDNEVTARKLIDEQPTIQPEITHEQAVEYLQSTGWMQEHDLQMMIDGAHRLTAQPEIIRCRECKFASGDSRICMKFDHSPIGELDFCSFAERRENE